MKKAFLTGENSLECRSSLFRLCRRYKDGDRLLRYVWEDMQVTPFQRNEMLHAAVTGGSIVTVKVKRPVAFHWNIHSIAIRPFFPFY